MLDLLNISQGELTLLCGRCGVNPRRSVGQKWCKECHAEYMRENRPKHSELSDEQRFKANARAYANVYQRRGKLIPEPCCKCGTSASVEKHHENYAAPLFVVWMCRKCHMDLHVEQEQGVTSTTWVQEVEAA